LSKQVKKIALIGPFVNDAGSLLGCWAARGRSDDAISISVGLRAKLPADAELTVVQGCKASESLSATHLLDGTLIVEAAPTNAVTGLEIQRAVDAASNAEVVILALGEPGSWSGENSARSTLDIPGHQMELFDAIESPPPRC